MCLRAVEEPLCAARRGSHAPSSAPARQLQWIRCQCIPQQCCGQRICSLAGGSAVPWCPSDLPCTAGGTWALPWASCVDVAAGGMYLPQNSCSCVRSEKSRVMSELFIPPTHPTVADAVLSFNCLSLGQPRKGNATSQSHKAHL